MKRLIPWLSAFPFYPLLIGVYAVLFLWSVNVGQLIPAVVWRSFLLSVGVCLVIFLACLGIFRKRDKAGLFSAWLSIIMLTYGHFYGLLEGSAIAGFIIGRHRVLLPLIGLLTLAVLIVVITARANLKPVTRSLNLIMLLMIAVAAAPIISYEVRYGEHIYQGEKSVKAAQAAPADAPDVYYIIMDGYSRADVLEEYYGFDNKAFVDGLKQLGFYLPDCTYSNYMTTTPSLSSSMNMEYLEKMGVSEKATTFSFDPSLAPLVVNSKVRQEFEGMGYKIAAFHGYMPALDLRDANYYFNYEVQQKHTNLIAKRNFEQIFMRTTLLRPLIETYEADHLAFEFLPKYLREMLYDAFYTNTSYGPYILTDMQWRDESEYSFKVLPTIPQLPGKKFVYAHFYTTHKPFIFAEDGGFLPQSVREDDVKGYLPTVKFAGSRLLPILKGLIEDSPVKPVIILQGDHGTALLSGVDHNKILNAYYFPDGDYSRLYKTITPVNTFRVVLSQFFQKDYPLLPDTIMVKDISPDGKFSYRHLPAACDLK